MAKDDSPPSATASRAPEEEEEERKKKKSSKRKRTHEKDAELERLDSLRWTPSLPQEDDDTAFALTTGPNQLGGGFLSLEEIDESEYGLDKLETEIVKPPKAKKLKETQRKKKKKKSSKKAKNVVESPAAPRDEMDHAEDELVDDAEDEAADDAEFYAWNDLRLHPLIMKSIHRLGFKEPTPIQKECIPAAAHQGKDIVGAAETGSGKTLAFGLPILQRLLEEREKVANMRDQKGEEAEKYAPKGVLRALIITPTRELALQVVDHLKKVTKEANIRVVPVVGGISVQKQERLLKARPEIVVGTPGRLWELMSGGEIHLIELHSLSFFVLDEADRMIENGHFHELQSIIDMLPTANISTKESSESMQNCVTVSNVQRKKRQTFVFSATIALSSDFRKKLKCGIERSKQSNMDGFNSIETLSERAGMRPNVAIIDLTNPSILAKRLEESFIECREDDKDAYLYYILSLHQQGRTIVFCTSVAALRSISSILSILGINVQTLHGQMKQKERLDEFDCFRESENGVLVATDVAARGLDIPGVRTVIHYQLPHSADAYIHRSGRTARAFADGCSIALISPKETSKFASLCRSFSKESYQRFPVEMSYMPEIMNRLSLARQIHRISRRGSQEKAEKNWLLKKVRSLELDVEKYDTEEETVNAHRQRKATVNQLKKLKQDLNILLSHPLQPKTFSHRYLAGAGVSPLLQQQFELLVKGQSHDGSLSERNQKRKFVVIGQDGVEPLQALRDANHKGIVNVKENADKRKNKGILRRERKEEKRRVRDQRRKQKKNMGG